MSPPPATGVWYDVDATSAAVMHKLRLQGGDVDATLIRTLVAVAGVEIDAYVDRVVVIDGPPPAPDFQHALEEAVILLYRADHPMSAGTYTATPYPDLLALFDATIGHRKERWAVA
jgi:hypothetical protein